MILILIIMIIIMIIYIYIHTHVYIYIYIYIYTRVAQEQGLLADSDIEEDYEIELQELVILTVFITRILMILPIVVMLNRLSRYCTLF